ncbi:MAG: chorismate synthase [Oligoflexia bacterium]|nr:chorismate synthase [Oligoflexia bacterium]
MAGNSFGQVFKVTTFGESHGEMIGAVIDGCPAGLAIDAEFIQNEMNRRRPGQSKIASARKEKDEVKIASGVFEGKTTGAPISLWIANEDARPADYAHLEKAYRPSHADFTVDQKYGHRDHRGGGRSSARETAARVAAGAIAKLLIHQPGISVQAWVSQIGPLALDAPIGNLDLGLIEQNAVRCPDPALAPAMIALIEETKKKGDTLGGVITCVIRGCPVGLGEPVFDKLHADLGKAMLSINAVKGFEYGSGFAGSAQLGSEQNDLFVKEAGKTRTLTNHSGGIQGGISNGMDIVFCVAFKPVATLMRPQPTIDREGHAVELAGKGRHDPCVVPRAVPIVEAMAALTLADHWLRNRVSRL